MKTTQSAVEQSGELYPIRLRGAEKKMSRAGKIKYGILAWMLGLPLPIIIIAMFFRGCDF